MKQIIFYLSTFGHFAWRNGQEGCKSYDIFLMLFVKYNYPAAGLRIRAKGWLDIDGPENRWNTISIGLNQYTA